MSEVLLAKGMGSPITNTGICRDEWYCCRLSSPVKSDKSDILDGVRRRGGGREASSEALVQSGSFV